MSGFLIESALLTHGLPGISDDRLRSELGEVQNIAWIEEGRLKTGGIEEFCMFRDAAAGLGRINYFSYDDACRLGKSGPLTASGTMRACELTGKTLAVTCGIGGIGGAEGGRTGDSSGAVNIESCNDLRALKASEVSMLATAFKDMFDPFLSIEAARRSGVTVLKLKDQWHPGYMFRCLSADGRGGMPELDKLAGGIRPGTLILNPVPEGDLIQDEEILRQSVQYGHETEAAGGVFHPAVNSKIEELTLGYSSELQLRSLLENIRAAAGLCRSRPSSGCSTL